MNDFMGGYLLGGTLMFAFGLISMQLNMYGPIIGAFMGMVVFAIWSN